MANYVKSTNYTAKDSLPSGNPAKIVKGSEFDTEFNNIATAIATKADTSSVVASSSFPNVSSPVTSSHTELNLLDNATATVIGRAYAEYLSNADLTTTIPGDDTVPQNTEGTQIISVAYTPKSITNRLRFRFQGEAAGSAAGLSAAVALFSSASASALKTSVGTSPATGYGFPLVFEYEYVPGVTSALTFSVRVGPISAGTIRMNGNTTTRLFGGTMGATLVIEEIAV